MSKYLLTSMLLALGVAPAAQALTITTVDGNADSGASLVNTLLGASSGLTVTSTSYIGAATQAGTYTGFNLTSSDPGEPTLVLDDGILLTSGSAALPLSNTDTGFTTETYTGSNAQVDTELAGAESFDGTLDQNVLEFTFTADPGITSVSTNFAFGSEEFPEYPGYADSFTFFVDGVNYAYFPGDIPIIQTGSTQSLFVADNSNGSYGIEYDGMSAVLTLVGLLDLSLLVHTITIVVADDADMILDSGVFLASLSGGTATGGGIVDPGTPPAVPLPASFPLLFGALGSFAMLRRKARK